MKKAYHLSLKLSLFVLTALFAQFARAQTPTLTYGTPDFDPKPGVTSITYTSSNTAVATIVAGKVHIVGVGTTTLTGKLGNVSGGSAINVVPAHLTITANSPVGVSGLALPALTVSYTGFVNGDTEAKLTTLPKTSTTATSSSPAGRYPVTVSGAAAANYTITYVPGTLTLTPLSAVTAPLPVKNYGDADFYAFGSAVAGINYTSSNPAVATIISGKIHIAGAGTATITIISGAGQLAKALTVNKAPLTITAKNSIGVSGLALPAFTAAYSGFVQKDTTSSLTTQPVLKTTATASSPAGNYPITASGAASPNYSISYIPGILTLAPLASITAPLPVKKYGDPDFYAFGSAVAGINYTSSNAAVATIVAGKIHITGGGTTTITIISGAGSLGKTLTVNKVPLTITVNNKSKVAGTANPVFTVTYSGFVNGDSTLVPSPVINTTATLQSPAGSYPIIASYQSSKYTITFVPGTLTVTAPVNVPPNISYNVAKSYIEGQTIVITPVSTGGPVLPGYYAQTTTFAGSGTKGSTNGTGTAASFNSPTGVVVDAQGNIYVADALGHQIRKITTLGVVTTFAGSGTAGAVNATGTAASFNQPTGIALDSKGNMYVADAGNNLIRKIDQAGVVTTFAGSGISGSANGVGTAASFSYPTSVAVDGAGNVYVIDSNSGTVRKISSASAVSTLATGFNGPFGLATDALGNVFVSDFSNRIFKVTPVGAVTVLAGSGVAGAIDATGTAAAFNNPNFLAVDASGNVYVADSGNNLIRKITPSGVVTTVAGGGNGIPGAINGIGTAATFNFPFGLAFDASGNMYVTTDGDNRIRKIALTGYNINPQLPGGLTFSNAGVISGNPTAVHLDTTNYTVTAYNKYGSTLASIKLNIANSITSSPNIFTIAGNGSFSSSGDGGPATGAGIPGAYATAMDKAGNLYIATFDNYIRKINSQTKIISTIAGTGVAGFSGDGGNARNAQLNLSITALAVDTSGNLYIADNANNRIRRIDAATNIINTIAGTGTGGYSGNGGPAISANLNGPGGMAIDATGNIYFVDENNLVIRKIDIKTLNISTVAGNGQGGVGGDGGQATSAPIDFVERIALDKNGNLYISEEGLGLVRKVDAATHIITTVAGISIGRDPSGRNYSGDGGAATSATFGNIMGLTFDTAGNLYIADQTTGVIRKVDASTHIISTYAGIGVDAYSGDGSPAINAGMNFMTDIFFDTAGMMYVDDAGNSVIRRIGGTVSAQTITFANIPSTAVGVADFNPGATSTSGLPIVYSSSNNAVAIIINGKIHPVSVGTSNITAAQPGNGSFTAATSVIKTVTVTPGLAIPNISYNAAQSYIEGNALSITPINNGGLIPQGYFGQLTTFAGKFGSTGSNNGSDISATFNLPSGIAGDKAGNIYIADRSNNLIRKITPAGLVSTFAGSGAAGAVNGTGTAASFNAPGSIAIDTAGNLYIAELNNNMIRKITPGGVVTTLAGSGSSGSTNGTGTAASFKSPTGIIVNTDGNIYVADFGNNMIRKITPAGVVTTFAGSGAAGAINATGTAASFKSPHGITCDQLGNLYVADEVNQMIRKITPAGVVTTFAGSGNTGNFDAVGTFATFYNPFDITIDRSGNLYIAELSNQAIRKITPSQVVSTVVAGGTGLSTPRGVGLDKLGNLYVSDAGNAVIRKVSLTGYAVHPSLPTGLSFSPNGVISGTPTAVSIDTTGYRVTAYNVTGSSTATVKVQVANANTTSPNIYTIAGNGTSVASGDGGPATAAGLSDAYAMARDKKGNIYLTTHENQIRKIDAVTHNISTIAGTGVAGLSGNGGDAKKAQFSFGLPGLAVDSTGNIYVSDDLNNRIQMIDAATNIVTTIAGSESGTAGYTGDGGLAASATLNSPGGLAIDAGNNIYFADENNGVIRKINANNKIITTYAGNGGFGYDGMEGVIATSAPIDFVERICLDKAGNLYIAEETMGIIRKIDASTHTITTVVGNPIFGTSPHSGGDGGPAGEATFGGIMGITFDAMGNLYIADQPNGVIRKVDSLTGIISTYAGIGVSDYSGDGSPAVLAGMNFPTDLALDAAGNLYIGDLGNNVIRRIGGTSANNPNNLAVTSLKSAVYAPYEDTSTPQVKQVLSPNGDGINDVLTINNIANYPENKLTLIDRNGTKIFEASGYDNVTKVFDGHSISRIKETAGTYFYLLEYKDKGTVKRKTGYFMIKY